MTEGQDTRIPPSLVGGKVKRVVLLPDGTPLIQVWRWRQWQPDDSNPSTLAEVAAGVSVPEHIMRILGIRVTDWGAETDARPRGHSSALP